MLSLVKEFFIQIVVSMKNAETVTIKSTTLPQQTLAFGQHMKAIVTEVSISSSSLKISDASHHS